MLVTRLLEAASQHRCTTGNVCVVRAVMVPGVCFFRLHPTTRELEVLLVKQKEQWTFPGVWMHQQP